MVTHFWKSSIIFRVATVLLSVSVFLFFEKNLIYTKSGDLALHYDLVKYLSDTWGLSQGEPPLRSGMNGYPPLSHYLAAVVGKGVGSPLAGLNVVSILSVFGCYFLFAEGVSTGSAKGTIVALAIAILALYFGRRQYAIEGYEIYYNFFYSQMVGELLFLSFSLWLVRSRYSWKIKLTAASVTVFVSGWLYLLSSIEVALSYVCLEGFFLARRVLEARRFRLDWALPMVAGGIILPALAVVHPTFRFMAAVSGNNGALDLHAFEHLTPRFSAALLIVSTALGVLSPESPRWRKGTLFLATAGCATAVAALAQFLVYRISGAGSDYAVKKYAYGVITLLIFNIGAAVATLIERKTRLVPARATAWALPPLFALGCAMYAPIESADRLDRFVKYERLLTASMADKAAPPDAWGNTVSRNHAFGWQLNHAATLVDLGMDLNKSIAAIPPELDSSAIGPGKYAYLDNAHGPISAKCVIPKAGFGGVSLVRLDCAPEYPATKLGDRIVLAELGVKPGYFSSGWSGKEPAGIWSQGKAASLVMRFEHPPERLSLVFVGSGYIPHPGYVQHIFLSVDGTALGGWTIDNSATSRFTASIPMSMVKDGKLKLDFAFPDATSPVDHKMSLDPRQLAFFVNSISVVD